MYPEDLRSEFDEPPIVPPIWCIDPTISLVDLVSRPYVQRYIEYHYDELGSNTAYGEINTGFAFKEGAEMLEDTAARLCPVILYSDATRVFRWNSFNVRM